MDRDTASQVMKNYHFLTTIDLGEGLHTDGRPVEKHKKKVLDIIGSMDLTGKRVIDLGCANGLYSLAAERSGAAEVIAVDNVKNNIECLTNLIIPRMNSKIKPWHMNVLDLDPHEHGSFDLVIFGGLLYHMRYPFWVFRVIVNLLRDEGELILESAMLEDFNVKPLLFYPTIKDSPYEDPELSCTFFNELALTETLERFGLQVTSRYVGTAPMKRILKKTAGIWPWYSPIDRIVLRCVRARALDNELEDTIFDGKL